MKSLWVRLVLVLVLALPGAVALAQEDQPVLGAVNIIVPNLFIAPADGEERPVFDLTTLETGETLRTDETGVALVTWFYDGTESALNANGSLTVNEFSGTREGAFVIDLTLNAGHLVSGRGRFASGEGVWTLTTPGFTVRLLHGQLEATVTADGDSQLIVTEGQAEVTAGGGDWIAIEANQYFTSAGGTVETLTGDDGLAPTLPGACTATANTNLVVRMFPSENSQRLDGVPEGQSLWVRAGTEGNLWLQVFFQTDPFQEDLHNYGWVYGPATTLDEAACGSIPRAVTVGQLYGGPGIDKADELTETEPIGEGD